MISLRESVHQRNERSVARAAVELKSGKCEIMFLDACKATDMDNQGHLVSQQRRHRTTCLTRSHVRGSKLC